MATRKRTTKKQELSHIDNLKSAMSFWPVVLIIGTLVATWIRMETKTSITASITPIEGKITELKESVNDEITDIRVEQKAITTQQTQIISDLKEDRDQDMTARKTLWERLSKLDDKLDTLKTK